LKSWTGETLQVVLTLGNHDTNVVVARGKKTFIQFGDEEPKTGAKAVEEGLAKLFGMAPELLSALTYRPQDKLGVFLSKDDAEKKEFLSKVLGLSSVEDAIEKSDALRKKLQTDLSYAQGILAEREAGLRRILEGLVEVSPDPEDTGFETREAAALIVLEGTDALVKSLDKKLDVAHKAFLADTEHEREAKKQKLETAKELYSKVAAENRQTNESLENQRQALRSEITKTSQRLAELVRVERDLAEAQERQRSLEKNECYVCHRPFTAELAIDEEREAIVNLRGQLEARPVLQKRLADLGDKLKALVPVVDPREAKFGQVIATLENEIRWLGKNITDTRVIAVQQERNDAYKILAAVKSDYMDAQAARVAYKKALETKAKLRAQQDEARKHAVKEVDTKRQEVAEIEAALNAEKDFCLALGKDGFLGAIFDEVLAEIGQEATAALGALPNTAHVSVHFRTENEKGKRSIVPVFVVDGFEATRQSGLSGGMGASADLAVDLGVAAVVERRLGTGPGWICLDETFNGMPKTTKEAALEILQTYSAAANKLVVVVDHGTEMKEAFQTVLTVTQENGTSAVS
jgi:DNA repair exonuclease SbcCD ATPase subunit